LTQPVGLQQHPSALPSLSTPAKRLSWKHRNGIAE
jgi:hypothetical protein